MAWLSLTKSEGDRMIFVYYHVTSSEDFEARIPVYFRSAQSLGLKSVMRKHDEPGLFMEIIERGDDSKERLEKLATLRSTSGIDKFIEENRIHTEIFDPFL